MKKRIMPALCLCSLLTLFWIGCKTPPKDTPAVPEEQTTVVEQPETVEQTGTVQDTGADVRAANAKLIEELNAARKKAVAAGADRYFRSELTAVDTESRNAQNAYKDGGDPAEFKTKASDIVYKYKALEQASLASTARKKINEMNFAGYAASEYNAAEKAAGKAQEMFKSGASGKDLSAQTQKVLDGYNAVLKAGYKVLAEKEREKVIEIKDKADAIKAGVADKTGYANAVAFFTRGNQELKSGQNEKAYNNFVTCRGMIDKVYQDVLKKRAAAEEAMARAKRRVEDADAVAVKADGIAPIEKVEALDSASNESGQEAR
ncbi:hypothetical protein V1L52_10375 [Treponema sp. HNW]|uniref:hypothetical protein n=1 Tax=Treponema sp. HNW TaxID=3116654 RepID=UPI003D09CADB